MNGEPLPLPTVTNQIDQMALYFINTQPYFDYPIIEELVRMKTNSHYQPKNRAEQNAHKIRFFGGISAKPSRILIPKQVLPPIFLSSNPPLSISLMI